jgi:hypothetical protein
VHTTGHRPPDAMHATHAAPLAGPNP